MEEDSSWVGRVQRAQALYERAPAKHRYYVRFKVPMDPVYRQICAGISTVDRVVDLGGGLGSLAALLALGGQGRDILSVDWDEEKVETAQRACAPLPAVSCLRADVHSYEIPEADVICLVDVLHYYPRARQRRLLERARTSLRPGGVLVIRETDKGGRSLVTRWIEGAAVGLRWNRGPGLAYRSRGGLVRELERLGLECADQEASSRVHRGNFLIWARRPVGNNRLQQ